MKDVMVVGREAVLKIFTSRKKTPLFLLVSMCICVYVYAYTCLCVNICTSVIFAILSILYMLLIPCFLADLYEGFDPWRALPPSV